MTSPAANASPTRPSFVSLTPPLHQPRSDPTSPPPDPHETGAAARGKGRTIGRGWAPSAHPLEEGPRPDSSPALEVRAGRR